MIMYVVGFLSQLFFSARTLLQWLMSEKTKQVVSPTIFWIFSLLGSYLMFIYGWMREDFSILLGQLITYYIYIWNLDEKGTWKQLHSLLKIIIIITPVVAIAYVIGKEDEFIRSFFKNTNVPIWLLVFGSIGQIIFTLRFVYQFFYSVKRNESMLPMGFWVLSLVGSLIIVIYAIIRKDLVLGLGQSVGFIAYIRNIMIDLKHPADDTAKAKHQETQV